MKQFKIRCSAIGQIMANSRTKGQLSKTAQSYVQEWLKEQIYNRRKDISNKYMDKGNLLEDESIDFLANNSDLGFLIKNEEYFENDFLTGTPDIITNEEVIDMKNSWDCFTFPLFYDNIPNKDYFYQLQGYMALTGKKKAKLVYTLMTTPEDLNYGKEDNYDNVDPKYRIKVFEVERDEEVIEAIKERVNEINNYIKQLNF
jgi:hypothetical protein